MSKLKSIVQNLKLLKFLLLILTFNFLLLTLPSPAFAQTSTQPSTPRLADARSGPSASPSVLPTSSLQPQYPASSFQLPAYIPPTSPLYTDLLVNNLFHSFSCLAIGQSVIGQPCLTYQVSKNAQGMIQSIPMLSSVNLSGGTLGAVTNVIGLLYQNPPVRTADYLASVGQGLGIVKEANAQVVGSGQAVLNPILGLWQVSRNISYVIMIIIFLIIGLMVMFRTKINPQTVISAQAAIPGLVIGLILITFSYFLAGLVSDMAFVGTNVVGYYFSAVRGQADKPQNLVQDISSESSVSIFSKFVGVVTQNRIHGVIGTIYDQLDAGTKGNLRVVIGFITAQFFAPLSAGIPPPLGLITAVAIPLLGGITTSADPAFSLSFLLSFIAGFVLIYAMLRLLLRLLSAYLTIIFLTISAPFQFLAAALPGRQGIATGWVLNLLANLLAFPAVLAVFYFVAFILAPLQPNQDFGPLKVSSLNQVRDSAIVPMAYAAGNIDIVGNSTFPLFGGLDLGFIRILVAFGALVALPTIPEIVARTVGKASQAGQLIGQEIGAGVGGGQKYAGQYQSAGTQGLQSTYQGIAGQREYRWVPGVGMEYGLVKPGLSQGIDRGGSWNPLKWKLIKP